ncbi:MAG TPA: sugar ABC transporter permease [Propionibacteriaceae bacterium]|nr:sugar ABC transporter permease [Propionibacteriaceae bacterium]
MTVSLPVRGGAPRGRQATRGRRRRRNFSFDRVTFFLAFLGVPVAVYIIFVVSPFVQAFYYSLTDWTGFNPKMDYIGLSNYTTAFTDDTFLRAIRNSVTLGIVVPLVTIVLSLTLATLITVGGASHGQTRGLSGSSFYRVISFFPYTIPAIIVGIMWSQVFDPSNGLVNGILTRIGLHQFNSFAWLGTESTAMPVSMFVIIWGMVGFYMVLFIAAIKGIPAEIYESARIDGANRFRTAIGITLPLIRENVQTAYIYLGIAALDAFVYMQALNSNGGPNNSTLVMSQYLYRTAFTKGQWGLACAMGVVLSAVTMGFAGLVFLVNRLTGGKDTVTLA